MREIKSRDAFAEVLSSLSESSKKYFSLSRASHYFDTKGKGDAQLIGALKLFTSPEVMGDIDLKILAPTISFTTWIKTSAQFSGGYLIRKRPVSSGDASTLSCWSWYLDASSGQELHFGAHDFYPVDAGTSMKQSVVSLENHTKSPPGTYLLAVIVNSSHAAFYRGITLLGVQKMPRPITDCFNNQEGVLVGDADMELGQLRFYPRVLTAANIEEVYEFGSTVSDISTVLYCFIGFMRRIVNLNVCILFLQFQ